MKKKLRLGKKTKDGYQYAAAVNLGQDLTAQIEEFAKEKEVKELLKKEVDKLSRIVKSFKNEEKENNISYYHTIGKNLKFLEKPAFKEVERWSAFRLLYEWLPSLLPHISDTELGSKHIGMMYYLGRADSKDLPRATWWQWYELVKFPILFANKKKYKKILIMIQRKGIKGSVRSIIKDALKNVKG